MFFRLFRNAVSLVIAGLIDKLAYVLFFAFIARKLSQSDFGAYNLVLTLIFWGAMITTFGIDYVIIRDIAKNRERSKILFNNALFLSLALSLFAWPLVMGLSFLLNYNSKVVSLISLGGATFVFIGLGQIASAVLKAHERMDILSLIESLHSIMAMGLGVSVVWMGGNLTILVVILIITQGTKAMTLSFIVHRHFTPIKWQCDSSVIARIIKEGIPFALVMAYGVILRRTDLLLLGKLQPLADVAIYASAAKFADLLSVFSAGMLGALFPALSATLVSSRQESWHLYNDSIAVFAILGFGATISVTVLAHPIILFVFGDTYLTGTTALRWLSWAFLFSVLCGPAGTLLLAAGDQMYRLLAMCAVLLISNVLLNLWLIPLFSYNGAAIATFVSTVLGFIGRVILSRIYFGRIVNFVRLCWRALLASLIMGLSLKLLVGLSIFVLVPIGGVVYALMLAAMGEFRELRYQPIKHKILMILKQHPIPESK